MTRAVGYSSHTPFLCIVSVPYLHKLAVSSLFCNNNKTVPISQSVSERLFDCQLTVSLMVMLTIIGKLQIKCKIEQILYYIYVYFDSI